MIVTMICLIALTQPNVSTHFISNFTLFWHYSAMLELTKITLA